MRLHRLVLRVIMELLTHFYSLIYHLVFLGLFNYLHCWSLWSFLKLYRAGRVQILWTCLKTWMWLQAHRIKMSVRLHILMLAFKINATWRTILILQSLLVFLVPRKDINRAVIIVTYGIRWDIPVVFLSVIRRCGGHVSHFQIPQFYDSVQMWELVGVERICCTNHRGTLHVCTRLILMLNCLRLNHRLLYLNVWATILTLSLSVGFVEKSLRAVTIPFKPKFSIRSNNFALVVVLVRYFVLTVQPS